MKKSDSKYCGCLYYSANALSRLMTKMADEEFAVVGLSSSYAFLLMTVNNKPGIQPNKISEEMLLSPSTITRLIEKMEQKKLVERKSMGRTTEVYPTEESLKLDPKIKEAWKKLYHRYSDLIGKDEAKTLTAKTYEVVNKIG
ncbi:MarR family winged helix-turn-helix transcriptional regulator [Flavobacterium soyangense]|uniref:Winged helix-turn-helix transcriptional regulator n=1 Tax=Flavobacterium soyangense TaxID=2023265 RepID=A0A930U949_9FLAO|nr:MarR family winged helix-turn-helix transcriptional regulator [Flavobacterium soyangense]MBF2708996.1 winged helix-turn-helix transcriptional regulator [Flavobacterium soyangense]